VYFLDINIKESKDGVVHAGHEILIRKFKTTEGKVKHRIQKKKKIFFFTKAAKMPEVN
jgi:hypothetical protein